MIQRRYFTIKMIATSYGINITTVEDYIKAFQINCKINNGVRCLDQKKLMYFDECVRLRKASGMTLKYMRNLPKCIIKDLINRL